MASVAARRTGQVAPAVREQPSRRERRPLPRVRPATAASAASATQVTPLGRAGPRVWTPPVAVDLEEPEGGVPRQLSAQTRLAVVVAEVRPPQGLPALRAVAAPIRVRAPRQARLTSATPASAAALAALATAAVVLAPAVVLVAAAATRMSAPAAVVAAVVLVAATAVAADSPAVAASASGTPRAQSWWTPRRVLHPIAAVPVASEAAVQLAVPAVAAVMVAAVT